MLKKSISVLMAALMIVSLFAVAPLSASAAHSTYGDFKYYTLGTTNDNGEWIENEVLIEGYTGSATSVTLPSKIAGLPVTGATKATFANNKTIQKVTFPSSVDGLASGAFSGCTALTTVDLSATSIPAVPESAFSGCTKLTTLKLPSTVTSIEKRAFRNMGLTSFTVPAAVTKIGERAFEQNTKLKTITFNSKLKSIGQAAFEECSALTSVSLPASLKTVQNAAFKDCTALTSVTIGAASVSFDYMTFYNCTALKTVKNNSKMTEIASSMFEGCSALTSVNIPSTVKSISTYAFRGCNALKSITIPSSVTTIQDAAFANCTSMKNLVVPKTVKKIGEYAIGFKNVHMEEIYYPDLEDSDEQLTGEKISGFTMYVVKNSAAHKWGKANGVTCATIRTAPTISKLENVVGGVKISWNKTVASGEKYRVFRKTSTGWATVGDTTGTSLTDKKVKSGTSYTYTVRCLSKDSTTFISDYNKTGKTGKYIATPAAPKLENTKNGVKISWTKVTGAENYRIFRKTGSGSWKKVTDISKAYVDKTAQSGAKYTYTIRCISKDGKSYTSGYNTKGTTITCKR